MDGELAIGLTIKTIDMLRMMIHDIRYLRIYTRVWIMQQEHCGSCCHFPCFISFIPYFKWKDYCPMVFSFGTTQGKHKFVLFGDIEKLIITKILGNMFGFSISVSFPSVPFQASSDATKYKLTIDGIFGSRASN